MLTRIATLTLALLLGLGALGEAQLADPSVKWYTFETEHFRVTYHEGTAGMAQLTAQAAEASYDWWAEKLGYAPEDTVEIVVVDTQDGPNGFANLTPNPQFVNFTAFAGFAGGFANSEAQSWEDLVTFHEYGHIVDLDFVQGLSKTLRDVFGRIVMPGFAEPTLFIEGIPTYGEFLYRGASRANEPRVAMMLRTMLLEHSFPTYQEASFYYDRDAWPAPGSISHDIGPWFMRFLEEDYGEDAFKRIKEAMVTDPLWAFGSLSMAVLPVPLSGDFNAILERVVGKPLDALWAEFQDWTAETFAAQIREIEAQGLTVGRRLTDHGFFNVGSAWDPDGAWIYYSHGSVERVGGLRRVRADGSDDQALTDGGGNPSVAPDGSFVLYQKGDVRQHVYVRNDLYRYDVESGRQTRLTRGERVLQAVVTPDGEAAIYARYNWGERTPSLHRIELASGEVTDIQDFPLDAAIENLALSPDGATLALSIWRRGGYQDLYTLPADGGELNPLTQDRATDYQPAWSPDGRYVLFSSDRTGVYNLYAYDVSAGELYQVSNVLTGALDPQVSPDGSTIGYTGYSARGYDLHRMPYDPEAWTPVGFSLEEIPAWEGFPDAYGPVTAYDPTPSLLPKLWYPVLGDNQAGAGTFGQDALFEQFYRVSGGWNWQANQPFFDLFYNNTTLDLGFSLNAGVNPAGYYAGANANHPLVSSVSHSQQLSAGYQRRDFGQLSQTVTAGWSMSAFRGLDLFTDQFSLSLSGSMNAIEGGEPVHKVVTSLSETLSLPVVGDHALSARLTGGWSDAGQAERGYAIGGTAGRFAVRGFERGVGAGRLAAAASLAYDFPLLQIERGVSLWPLFFDDLEGSLFLDAGMAGEELSTSEARVGVGVELRLGVLLSYFGGPVVTLGVAQGVGAQSPQVYFNVGL